MLLRVTTSLAPCWLYPDCEPGWPVFNPYTFCGLFAGLGRGAGFGGVVACENRIVRIRFAMTRSRSVLGL